VPLLASHATGPLAYALPAYANVETRVIRIGSSGRRDGLEAPEDQAPQHLASLREPLTSTVAERLRDQIIRGEIPEGAQLRQHAIAAQFRVSRIPVREALRQLDAEGLINIIPNRGAIVPALSPKDVEELFTIRTLLEPEVLKLSIPHLTPGDFAHAEALLNQYVDELETKDQVPAWGRLNWQFHSTLYSRANRPHLMSSIRNVNNRVERYSCLQLDFGERMKRVNQEHAKILELCRKRETSAACTLLRQHIQHAGLSLRQALEDRCSCSI
jgi:DNA-binding GntR family transcriptional regulator